MTSKYKLIYLTNKNEIFSVSFNESDASTQMAMMTFWRITSGIKSIVLIDDGVVCIGTDVDSCISSLAKITLNFSSKCFFGESKCSH